MGGLNLEFGVYVMFPIGIMYYFGTNLDNRFAVTNFWPRPEECNKVPRDRDEVKAEYERIVARRRAFMAEDEAQRARRAAAENRGGGDS